MAWKQYKKRSGRAGTRPSAWNNIALVSTQKTGICFSKGFIEAYMGDRSALLAFFDKDRLCIGFKVPGPQDEPGYKVRQEKDGAFRMSCKDLCKDIAESCPALLGKYFRVRMNTGERIIEVELSVGNAV